MIQTARDLVFPVLILSTFFAEFTTADTAFNQRLIDSYHLVCKAQYDVARCEKELSEFRFEAIENLYLGGNASWLEMRKSKLALQEKVVLQKFLRQFEEFVDQIAEQVAIQGSEEKHFSAIKVFLPGSNRVVGWIEGVRLDTQIDKNQLSDAQYELEINKRLYDQAKKRLGSTADGRWNRKMRLNASLAEAKWKFARSKYDYLKKLQTLQSRLSKNNQTVVRRTLRPEHSPELESTVRKIASLEANRNSDILRLRFHLQRQQQRLDAVEELAQQGYATNDEIGQIQQRVMDLKYAIESRKLDQQNLAKVKFSNGEVIIPTSVVYEAPSSWPTELFVDPNQIQYLIEQRRACYMQQSKIEIAQQRLILNQTIIERLTQSNANFNAKQGSRSTRTGKLLSEGQQKELNAYVWKNKSLKFDIDVAKEKQKVLILEEERFLKQVALISELPELAPDLVDAESLSVEANVELLNSMLLLSKESLAETKLTKHLRFGYIESNIVDTLGFDVGLVMLQSNGYPLGRFEEDDDLLRPVQLIDYSRRMSYSPVRSYRLQVGPNYTGTLWTNDYRYARSANSNRGIAAPSLYNSPFATDSYRRNQVKSTRHHARAYPFGILRSDLRTFTTPGQPPWLIPGSPNNLRYNQLRTDALRSPNGKTGNQILKSKNYLDLSRPYDGSN